MLRWMTTGEKGAPLGEAPPLPGLPPVFPSKDEFSLTYYSSTPVSSVPSHRLRFSRKYLTCAQTCRKLEIRRPSTSIVHLPVAQRVHVRSHRLMEKVHLLAARLILLLHRAGVRLFSPTEIWGTPRLPRTGPRHIRGTLDDICMHLTMSVCT